MFNSSCIELSRRSLKKNIRFIRQKMKPGVVLSAVVKSNAYGHGIEAFVPLAEECGVSHFSVFGASEALRVHSSISRDSEIMIMGYVDEEAMEWCISNSVSFYVFDMGRLQTAVKTSKRLGVPARIHMELETGMNRTGFNGGSLQQAVDLVLREQEHIIVDGVCTHFAGAESIANYKRIQDQIAAFESTCNELKRAGVRIGKRHCASSAAAFNYPDTQMDMVRIGIALYGFWPNKETEMQHILNSGHDQKSRYVDPLKRVLRWNSWVMSVKDVPQGEFVGYGTSYLTTRRQKIASVPVGYYHGFRRSLSNLGRVLIHGRRADVVGTINMNMLLVNVSEIPDVKPGDEVVIIGKQNNAQITVASFSDLSNLLNYEALVRLPEDIPRLVVD